jgi:hypothetical protein
MLRLPSELLLLINSLLGRPDTLCFAAVCKKIRYEIQSNSFFPVQRLLECATKSTTDKQAIYFFPPIRKIQWCFNSSNLLLDILQSNARSLEFFQYLFQNYRLLLCTVEQCCAFLRIFKNTEYELIEALFLSYREKLLRRLDGRLV